MNIKKLFLIGSIASVSLISSCKTNLLAGEQEVPVANKQPAQASAPVVVEGMRTSYADVVEKTSPAVVKIKMERKETAPQGMNQFPFPDEMLRQFGIPGQQMPQQQKPQIERGAGSGVIVNSDGTILTNNHVVENADKITVQLSDNKTYDAKVIGTDAPSDLAVIKIDAKDLPFLTLGNSDNVRVGDIVLAIGNPLDIGESVTSGIISAKGRRTGLSDGSFEDFLQTDAAINRGNSGGALVNLSGELIGINSQILSGGPNGGSIGIGFSIPSNMAKIVMDQLVKDGKVRRGMLGIGIQTPTDALAEGLDLKDASGVLVGSVNPGSAADKAGIKRYDLITAINGEKMTDSNALRNKVAGTPPGTEIRITILRDGKEQELTATLDELKTPGDKKGDGKDSDEKGGAEKESGKLGLSLQPVTPQIAKQLELEADEGLVVTAVDQNGPAAEAGIQRGDVILEINRKAVNSVEDVKSILSTTGNKTVVLLVNRKGQTTLVPIQQ
jgi:Do/DeqQ family serine protease